MAEKITEKRESFSCSLISQARHLYVPRLNTLSNCSSIGLRAWLSESENYIPIKLPLSGCFEIDFYDISEALSALAHDIVRLTCASFETVDAISEIPMIRTT